ncbi:MAG: von Willebrand factor type A [Planctomycetota bacterium]|nr:MAG: von Willebrand factor type A [Planctomycetota bacterium]
MMNTAVVMVVLLGFVAMTIDVGFIELTRTQLQSAADASALSGAMELSGTDDPALVRTNARNAVIQAAAMHRAGDKSSVAIDPIADITFGKLVWNGNSQNYSIQWGEDATPYNVIKVRALRMTSAGSDNRLPLFFAPAIGSKNAEVGAEAIATFQPRDIMVVLDFSGSMNDDSCFGGINKLGRSYIESNLQTMWTQLGSPVYGNLTVTPKYATLKGRAASGTIPHIDVTFKRTSVDVVSTLNLTSARLKFSNGATQTFSGLTGKLKTLAGTGGNSGKDITNCWVTSGTNASLSSGNLGEQFDFTLSKIKTALGLTTPYPYPGGSWDEYIQEVQKSSNNIKAAGYRDMYGYMTWLEYLQTQRYSSADTPDLWKTSEQPVGSMKDAVGLFTDYLTEMEAEDYVGLSIYTHTNSAGAILEHGLSRNLDQIKSTTQQRQAGHYKPGTNISAGMKTGRDELVQHARPRAARLMVLMTDGEANEPGNSATAKAAVIAEANAAAAAKIKILTISLGAGADTSLMQQVADITKGEHFNVPGGSSITDVQTQLELVFRKIANSRTLKLISDQ